MRLRAAFVSLLLSLITVLWAPDAVRAQGRLIEVDFTPTARAQIAIWLESPDGTYLQTLKLTEAVARRGVGNRPGAMQMNSGFHWPYGRREGVLPVWAHRRAGADGASQFHRVIFQNRTSEGFASRTSNDASPDDYYCLSFNTDASSRDRLDAVTCPSQFNSDKGRYLTDLDVTNGYAEPWETERGASTEMRTMGLTSVYPPRRDLPSSRGMDHDDMMDFDAHARAVMPEIDAVTMATLPADEERQLQVMLPEDYADGQYVLFIEVNVEGDYAPEWGPARFPTPVLGSGWDSWARGYGYAYRGQPSIVYRVEFTLDGAGGVYSTNEAVGYGDIHGANGDVTPIDGTIADNPEAAPGSGVDRLRAGESPRLAVRVVPSNVCDGDDPPPQCFRVCSEANPCDDGFICNVDGMCVGRCDEDRPPSAITDFEVTIDDDRSWQYANLRFTAPSTARMIRTYQVRVHTQPFEAGMRFEEWGTEAKIADLEDIALVVPTDGAEGTEVVAALGHLIPETHYYVAMRAVDDCADANEVVVQEIDTTEIIFTTVSPCFVATAAYGTPLAAEISVLRQFRDRHLMTNGVGRALVEAYYEVGPVFADWIRPNDWMRERVRGLLSPAITLLEWLED